MAAAARLKLKRKMYAYSKHRAFVFTEEGQGVFLLIRDRVKYLLNEAGAVTMGKAIHNVGGDSWNLLACVDRLVEIGEIREVAQDNPMGQNRIFVAK